MLDMIILYKTNCLIKKEKAIKKYPNIKRKCFVCRKYLKFYFI